jgi:hypothetical protein
MAVLAATVFLGTAQLTGAQAQYSKVLIGKWEGDVRLQSSRDNPARTLIVESVGEGEAALAVKGKYGITGRNLSGINGTLETAGGQARLRFTTSANSNVVLELQGDKDLVGIIDLPGVPGRAMRLKKVE